MKTGQDAFDNVLALARENKSSQISPELYRAALEHSREQKVLVWVPVNSRNAKGEPKKIAAKKPRVTAADKQAAAMAKLSQFKLGGM